MMQKEINELHGHCLTVAERQVNIRAKESLPDKLWPHTDTEMT